MNNILFGKINCPQCDSLKSYLDELGVQYDYIDATDNIELLHKYAPGARSVPQFVHNTKLIGDMKQVIRAIGNGEIDV